MIKAPRTDHPGPFQRVRVEPFAKVESHMGLFIIVAVLGAAWLLFSA